MDPNFVPAYRIDTGEKVRIPAHWLDHPVLGKPFRLTPKASATRAVAAPDAPAPEPTPRPRGRHSGKAAPSTAATPAPDLVTPTTPDAGEKE